LEFYWVVVQPLLELSLDIAIIDHILLLACSFKSKYLGICKCVEKLKLDTW